ncbi:MAG: Crp/Fnr family transcriptional regulator [Methylotenera sp.]|nr:Crp/Fnr family transcriptional regulator [Oligoflexia bacterium]
MSDFTQKPLAPGSPTAQAAAPQAAPAVKRLKKGELLFSEGDNSSSMYLLKTGMIRIFKKKGEANIEIDTIRAGQILGELAFLDGNPRSASGEALMDCELMEISANVFQAVVLKMPDWLKILLKTVVSRLRATSTRIKQLESSSSAYDYSEKDGKKSAHYVYLSSHDALKISTAILLVASRNGTEVPAGIDIRLGVLQRYANQILNIPVAKITSFVDLLTQAGLMTISEGSTEVTLKDIDFMENLITYINDENLLEPSKRHDITLRGFLVMSMINKNLAKYPVDEITGLTTVNVAEIRSTELNAAGKESFRLEEFPELANLGYCTPLSVKSGAEQTTLVKATTFQKFYRFQRVTMMINALNEQKRRTSR